MINKELIIVVGGMTLEI